MVKEQDGHKAKGNDYHDLEHRAWITGADLDSKEVRRARMTESDYAQKNHGWTKNPRSEALGRGWMIVKKQ